MLQSCGPFEYRPSAALVLIIFFGVFPLIYMSGRMMLFGVWLAAKILQWFFARIITFFYQDEYEQRLVSPARTIVSRTVHLASETRNGQPGGIYKSSLTTKPPKGSWRLHNSRTSVTPAGDASKSIVPNGQVPDGYGSSPSPSNFTNHDEDEDQNRQLPMANSSDTTDTGMADRIIGGTRPSFARFEVAHSTTGNGDVRRNKKNTHKNRMGNRESNERPAATSTSPSPQNESAAVNGDTTGRMDEDVVGPKPDFGLNSTNAIPDNPGIRHRHVHSESPPVEQDSA